MQSVLSDVSCEFLLKYFDNYTDFVSLYYACAESFRSSKIWDTIVQILKQQQRAYWSLPSKKYSEPMAHPRKMKDFSCLSWTGDKTQRILARRISRQMDAMNTAETFMQKAGVNMVLDQDQMDLYSAIILPFPGCPTAEKTLQALASSRLVLCAWEPIITRVAKIPDPIQSIKEIETAVQAVWRGWRSSRGHQGDKQDTPENRICSGIPKELVAPTLAKSFFDLMLRDMKRIVVVNAYAAGLGTPMRCDEVYLILGPNMAIILFESCEF
eukprot:TRINITY_DN16281_c0_g1_i1.p1 TRINITY_DN16281_c0_g1~~TRINITY_DN16281_c0_g1_i1.p1  ORF type:complete len:269 (+),score=25.92 TRINITY_DN16281_c0_g1_i1:8-814(+)